LENLPAMHAVHVLAPLLTTPVPAPTSTMDPGVHVVHNTVDTAENLPGLHAVHVVAALFTTPVPAPFSATDPALHIAHAVCGEALYRPAAHAVHDEAPVRLSRSVLLPVGHAAQLVCPVIG
jgi:hypothetical protein